MKRFFLLVIALFFETTVWGADVPLLEDDTSFDDSFSLSPSSSDDDYGREIDKMLKPGPFECRGCFRKNNTIGELRAGLGNQQIRYEARVGRLRAKHQKELGQVEAKHQKDLELARNTAREDAKGEYEVALAKQEEQSRLMAKQTGEGVRKALTERYRGQKRSLRKKHEEELEQLREESKRSRLALIATVMRVTQGDEEEDDFHDHPQGRFLHNIQAIMRRRQYTMSILRGSLKGLKQQKSELEETVKHQKAEIGILRALRPMANIQSGILALFCSGQAVDAASESGAAPGALGGGGFPEPMSDDSGFDSDFALEDEVD